MSRPASFTVHARIGDHDGSVVVVLGREAWALRMRVAPGEHRCTPIDHPGPGGQATFTTCAQWAS